MADQAEDEDKLETGIAADLGAATFDLARGAWEMYSVFVRTLYYVFRGKREKGATVRQMYEMGNKSLLFVTITMGFIGMILVYQSGLQTKRILPEFSQLGSTYLELLTRDLASSLTALMLATRVGAGIAAELGSMVVTEQVDALRMSAADPIDYLVKPRFLASIVMTACLIIWGGFVAYTAGGAVAYFAYDVAPRTFFSTRLVDHGDVITGLAKALAYGAAIPIVSSYCGLSAHGGSEGVGWATTRAVVNSSLAIILLNFFISVAAFVIFPK
jgi:phospholipid/cholesterol/gamma-HCH transport system permease protein